MKKSAWIALITLTLASCQSELTNEAPFLANKLRDAEISSGLNAISISLANTFSDPDGDVLTYEATSSDEQIVKVVVRGSLLTSTRVASGTAEITVTAIDPMSNKSSDSFKIRIQ